MSMQLIPKRSRNQPDNWKDRTQGEVRNSKNNKENKRRDRLSNKGSKSKEREK